MPGLGPGTHPTRLPRAGGPGGGCAGRRQEDEACSLAYANQGLIGRGVGRTLPHGPNHLTPRGCVCRGCLCLIVALCTPGRGTPSRAEEGEPPGSGLKKKRETENHTCWGPPRGSVKPPHPYATQSLTPSPHTASYPKVPASPLHKGCLSHTPFS